MFNFFKKNTPTRKVPDDYKHLVSQADYEAMLDIILQYFKEKGEPVLRVENGYVITNGEEGTDLQHQYGLDNLVRLVAAVPRADRESVIYAHFNKAYYDMRPLEYFKKDYEAAKQYLKILIKPAAILKQPGGNNVVHKIIFPGTCSVLVFDYDNKFAYLYHEMVKEWGKTIDELFAEALDNISNEEINWIGLNLKTGEGDGEEEGSEETEEGTLDVEKQDAFLFVNPDFGAPAVCLMEQKASFAIGRFGSIVAIPCKRYGVMMPIKDGGDFERVSPLSIIVAKLFNGQPGNITADLYWYYEEQFHLMEETQSADKEGYLAITLPQALIQLLKEA